MLENIFGEAECFAFSGDAPLMNDAVSCFRDGLVQFERLSMINEIQELECAKLAL